MIQRNSIVIDSNKSKKFVQFLNSSAKDEKYWNNVKKGSSINIDKKELNKLFEKK